MRLGLSLPAGREIEAARLAESAGLFGVLVSGERPGVEMLAAAEDLQVLRRSWAARPLRHRGARWAVPAGIDGHAAPASVAVTPEPAQLDLPVWLEGDQAGALAAGTGLPILAERPADASADTQVQPAIARDLAPEAAMPDFPRIMAESPLPLPWPRAT